MADEKFISEPSQTAKSNGSALAQSNLIWIVIGGSILALGLAYYTGIENLVVRWYKEEEYGHGFIIPFISLFFVWQQRAKLRRIPLRPSWIGAVLVLYGLFQLAIGEFSALYILIHTSLLIVLSGLVISFAGIAMFRAVLVPILILGFGIPLPYFIDAILTWRLQLLSSVLGVSMIRGFGIPVFLDGNIIDLGIFKLQVVEACSGLRYMFPLLSLGFIAAYMFRAPIWQKAVVFLSAIPITIFMNSFRIGVIGVLVDKWGIQAAEGFLHDFEGWFIFMACTIVLIAEIWLFSLFRRPRLAWSEIFRVPEVAQKLLGDVKTSYRLSRPFLVSFAGLLVAGIFISLLPERVEAIPSKKSFPTFPTVIGDWSGSQGRLEEVILNGLQMDDYIYATYRRADGPPINFFIAYYNSQRKGVSPHSPRVCIPGGGWRITEFIRTELELPTGRLPINRGIIEKGGNKQLVYYWFQQRGRKISNEYWMKWYLLVDALMKNRTDGALVRIVTPVRKGDDIEKAEKRARDFIAAISPVLPEYVPD